MCEKPEVERCDYLVDRFDITWTDEFSAEEDEKVSRTCLRPEGHEGPHLIEDHFGRFVIWEAIEDCLCADCRSPDPMDHCLSFELVSAAEAKWLRDSLQPVYTGSPEAWIASGEAVLRSLPPHVLNEKRGQYFYCNIRDGSYVIGKDYTTASERYAREHFLPSEGWTIYGVIIQEKHF